MALSNMFGQMRGAMQAPGQAAPARQMPQRPGMQQAAPQQRPGMTSMGRFGAGKPMSAMSPAARQGQMFGRPAPQRGPSGLGGMMGAVRGGMGQQPAQPGGGMTGRVAGAMAGGRPMMGGVGQAMGQRPNPMTGAMGMAGGMLSDERSKERIRELEGIKERYEALLDTPSATAASFKGASSNEYEYEDPDAPGAAPGRHAGPMASELRSIPGVVSRGPDGMDRVDPGRLSLANASAQGETSRELDDLKARLAALEDDPDAVLREASGGR